MGARKTTRRGPPTAPEDGGINARPQNGRATMYLARLDTAPYRRPRRRQRVAKATKKRLRTNIRTGRRRRIGRRRSTRNLVRAVAPTMQHVKGWQQSVKGCVGAYCPRGAPEAVRTPRTDSHPVWPTSANGRRALSDG